MCVSEDGLHVAVVTPSRTKQRVYYDGQPGPEFDEILHWSRGNAPAIRIARNGAHVAYLARRGGTAFLCLDDNEIEVEVAADEKGQQLFTFSPDSQHLVYPKMGEDGLWHVVFDNAPDPGFTDIAPPILFTADGGHYAYIGQSDKGQSAVVDGKAGPAHQNVDALQFSPDGKHYAYQYTDGDKFVVTLDGKTGPSYDGVQPGSIQFTANGNLAYSARKDTGYVAVVDGKKRGEAKQIEQLQVSFDGKRIAFVSTTSDGQTAVVDGKAGPGYEKISSLMFSPDGVRVAYIGELSTGKFVVVDEKESPAYRSVGNFQFASAGHRYGYVGSTEKGEVVVVDGRASRPYAYFLDLAISPDGSRYAYEGDVNLLYVAELVIDGKAARARNLVATLEPDRGATQKKIFQFSPDSKHLAMASVVSGGAKYVVTVDGIDGPSSGRCYCFTFSPDSSHFAYATREPIHAIWNIAVTVDRKIVQSIPMSPQGDEVLIAQALEESRNGRLRSVNPNYFQFRDDGKLKYLAVKDGKMLRVSVTPGAVVPAAQDQTKEESTSPTGD
jgi:WD40 repeat protein